MGTQLDAKLIAKLNKMGYKVGQAMGSGNFGTAYTLKNDPHAVLKVTNDISEAKTSSKLIGKHLKNVAKIERVFAFSNKEPESEGFWNRRYFIILERLHKIDSPFFIRRKNSKRCESELYGIKLIDVPKLRAQLQELSGADSLPIERNIPKALAKSLLSETDDDIALMLFWSEFFNSRFGSMMKREFSIETQKMWAGRLLESYSDLRGYLPNLRQLFNGLKELKALNIEFIDTHWDNIMQDSKKNWKFIDLGFTKGDGADFEILERYLPI